MPADKLFRVKSENNCFLLLKMVRLTAGIKFMIFINTATVLTMNIKRVMLCIFWKNCIHGQSKIFLLICSEILLMMFP